MAASDVEPEFNIEDGNVISTNNSSTANIAGSGTFVGTADDMTEYATVIILFRADTACTVFCEQSPDGTNWDISDSYSVAASFVDSRAFAVVAKFTRVRVVNTSASTATNVRLQTRLYVITKHHARTTIEYPIFATSTSAMGVSGTYTTPTFYMGGGQSWLGFSVRSSTQMSAYFDESTDGVTFTQIAGGYIPPTGSQTSSHKYASPYGRMRFVNGPAANAGGTSNLQILVSQSMDGIEGRGLDIGNNGTISALSGTFAVSTSERNTLSFSVSGAWAGTLLFQAHNGDFNWQTMNGVTIGGAETSTLTADNIVIFNCASMQQIRAYASSWTSGTASFQSLASVAKFDLPVSVVSPIPAATISNQQSIGSGVTAYTLYTATQKLAMKQFYAGGTGIGKQELFSYVSGTTSFVNAGDFESSGDVSNWVYTTNGGTGTLAFSTAQHNTGSGSMLLTFSSSDANHLNGAKQTFSPTLDVSVWRYISAYFFNVVSTGGAYTRTITIILTDSNASTRSYVVSGLSTVSPFNGSNWINILGDIANPTSSTGTIFDPTKISSIELRQSDSANKTGTGYWDTVQLIGALTPLFPIYHAANTSFNLPIDPVIVLNIGSSVAISQTNNDASTKEYYALVGAVSIS